MMLAASARTYLNRYGVLPGRRAVVFTTNDSAYAAALDLAASRCGHRGSSTPAPPGESAERASADGIEVRPGTQWSARRAAEEGETRLTAETVAVYEGDPAEAGGTAGQRSSPPTCSSSPAAGTRWCSCSARRAASSVTTARSAAFVPDTCRQAVEVAGSAAGALDLPSVLAQGVGAASRALAAKGYAPEAPRLPAPDPAAQPHTPPMHVYAIPDASDTRSFVDLQRDVTVADLPAPPAPACGRWSTSSATRRSARQRPGPDVRPAGQRYRRRAARRRHLGPRHDHVPAAVHPRLLRHPRGPRPGRAARPGPGRPRCTPGTSSRARCSRTSASGSAPGTTRGPARTWRRPSCASAPPPATAWPSWTPPPSARSTSRARTREPSSTCSTPT